MPFVPRFGRLFLPDPRDALYPMRQFLPPRPLVTKFWATGPVIDQEKLTCTNPTHTYCVEKGFCVGCAWWGWLAAEPLQTLDGPEPLAIYHRAQELDEWPGAAESYAGTSVRGGAKALAEFDRIERYVWAWTAQDVAAWVAFYGTVVLGTNWYASMLEPKEDGHLKLRRRDTVIGGHAYLVYGYDHERGVFWIQNSWGKNWGVDGRAYMDGETLDRLLREHGEACAAIEKRPVGA